MCFPAPAVLEKDTVIKKTNHQKDRFFAKKFRIVVVDCSEGVLGQKHEDIVRRDFVSRRLSVKEISQELFR